MTKYANPDAVVPRRGRQREREHAEQVAFIRWAAHQRWDHKHPDGRVERLCLKDCIVTPMNGAHLAGNTIQRINKVKRLKDAGMRVGASDLIILYATNKGRGEKDYPYGAIEMKKRVEDFPTPSAARKAVSDEQSIFLQFHHKLGAYTAAAYGWEHAAYHACTMMGWDCDKRIGAGWQKAMVLK